MNPEHVRATGQAGAYDDRCRAAASSEECRTLRSEQTPILENNACRAAANDADCAGAFSNLPIRDADGSCREPENSEECARVGTGTTPIFENNACRAAANDGECAGTFTPDLPIRDADGSCRLPMSDMECAGLDGGAEPIHDASESDNCRVPGSSGDCREVNPQAPIFESGACRAAATNAECAGRFTPDLPIRDGDGSCRLPMSHMECAGLNSGAEPIHDDMEMDNCRAREVDDCPAEQALIGGECVTCNANQHERANNARDACEECPANQHLVGGSCQACPANEERARGEAECTCDSADFYPNPNGSCDAFASCTGTEVRQDDNTCASSCDPVTEMAVGNVCECSAGHARGITGSCETEVLVSTCAPNQEIRNNECAECPANQFRGTGNASCTSCDTNEMRGLGDAECSCPLFDTGSACVPVVEVSACGPNEEIRNNQCAPCLENQFRDMGSACESCPPNEVRAAEDAMCSCPLFDTGSECVPVVEVSSCAPNADVRNNLCSECPVNQFRGTDNASCMPCDTNEIRGMEEAECSCPLFDTGSACVPVVELSTCGANEHVVANVCAACPPNQVRELTDAACSCPDTHYEEPAPSDACRLATENAECAEVGDGSTPIFDENAPNNCRAIETGADCPEGQIFENGVCAVCTGFLTPNTARDACACNPPNVEVRGVCQALISCPAPLTPNAENECACEDPPNIEINGACQVRTSCPGPGQILDETSNECACMTGFDLQEDGSCAAQATSQTLADCAETEKLLNGACAALAAADCLPTEKFEGGMCVLLDPEDGAALTPPYGEYTAATCTDADWPWSIVQTTDGLSELCHAPVNLLATDIPSSQTLDSAEDKADFCVLRGAESGDSVRCDDPTVFGSLGIPPAPAGLVTQITTAITITLADGATREAATLTAEVTNYLQIVHSGGSVAAVFPPETAEAEIITATALVGTISLEVSVTPPLSTNTVAPPATNTVAPPAPAAGGGGGGGGGAAAALIAVPVVLIGGYWLLGGFDYLDTAYNLNYSGENSDFSYRGDAGFDLNHGSLSSYARAIQSNGDAVSYESGISYKKDFYSLNYAAYESKSIYDYDLRARLNYGEGLWSISPTADAEFNYSAHTEDWTSAAGAGLTAAWTSHKWNIRAHSAFAGDLNHGLDVEFRF